MPVVHSGSFPVDRNPIPAAQPLTLPERRGYASRKGQNKNNLRARRLLGAAADDAAALRPDLCIAVVRAAIRR